MRVPPLSPVSVDSSAALSGWEEVWDSRSELVTAELSELSWAWELEGTELSGRALSDCSCWAMSSSSL